MCEQKYRVSCTNTAYIHACDVIFKFQMGECNYLKAKPHSDVIVIGAMEGEGDLWAPMVMTSLCDLACIGWPCNVK